MNRVIAIVAFMATLHAVADDSYLYWMVGTGAASQSYDSVKIIARNDSTGATSFMNLYYGDGVAVDGNYSVSKDTAQAYQTAGLGMYASLMTSGNYSYAIELFSGDTFVAQSSSGGFVSAADLAQYIVNSPMATPIAAWAPTSYAVPEPNSGLLVLIGSALLALKRKRRPHA